MGNLSWAEPAWSFVRAHYIDVQDLFNNNLKNSEQFGSKSFRGSNITPSLVDDSYASMLGWGASCVNEATRNGPWLPTDSRDHKTELELQGPSSVLQAFTRKLIEKEPIRFTHDGQDKFRFKLFILQGHLIRLQTWGWGATAMRVICHLQIRPSGP